MPDLLLELFSEEIPARMQARAAKDLKRLVTSGLADAGLACADAAAFATPRRLALSLAELPARSPDQREERKGPRVDAPEKAVEGFLRSTGLTREQLEVRGSKKGDVYFAVFDKPGRAAEEVIATVIPNVVRNFPWPKSMRWGGGDLKWVRPLHSVLCLLSDEAGARTVGFEVGGIASGDTTSGHRFMGPAEPFSVTGFDDYAAKLRSAKVILDPAERAEAIWHDATQLAFAKGLEVVEDKGLLDEVAGLVEWPVPLMGEIGAEFLDLPSEVLQTSMKEHQKFFSVSNPKTGRIENYITVANIEAPDGGKSILEGNGRVLTARLADAKFFWENDLRKSKGDRGLQAMAESLSNVVFHAKLGTQAQRIDRMAALAREIAPHVGADPDLAEQAARIAKADLASEMVYEFPELQGVMGKYYALEAGLPEAVANACEMHYSPLGPTDDVPTEPVSIAVALADKLDTLTGFWAIDEKPTGSKDPFALRRAALGVIRILIEADLTTPTFAIALSAFNRHIEAIERRDAKLLLSRTDLTTALDNLDDDIKEAGAKLFARRFAELEEKQQAQTGRSLLAQMELSRFVDDRLKVYLRDKGVRHDVIDAVAARPQRDVVALRVKRAMALQAFLATEDGANLLTGYRRARNILTAEEKKDGVAYEGEPDVKFAEQSEETELFAALDAAEARIVPALEAEDFAAAMTAMAEMRAPIDAFFDEVMVNADNPVVRRNRLCLLNRIRGVMERVAIFSAIEG